MAFEIAVSDSSVSVHLSGWHRLMVGRKVIQFESQAVRAVAVVERSELEPAITHRELGCGTHNGAKRPGRSRVGSMRAQGLAGKQFWSVSAGSESSKLALLDLVGHEYSQAVLEVGDPEALVVALETTHPGDA